MEPIAPIAGRFEFPTSIVLEPDETLLSGRRGDKVNLFSSIVLEPDETLLPGGGVTSDNAAYAL